MIPTPAGGVVYWMFGAKDYANYLRSSPNWEVCELFIKWIL